MTEPMHEPQQTVGPNQAAAPTPGSVNGDVPVETWRRKLVQISEAPGAERHGLLSVLLDDLDSQVSSL
ncbi:hypothetical protein AAFP32_09975 [Brevibacterium sp. CBA3109]|uniref:Uncharacterized protein n=1 Tax=Brevibacterium koreense TaxID=3140787 RepID=A0AAU7UHG4_9MICO